nr:hypothetical protein [uncultured Roseateles sp.]
MKASKTVTTIFAAATLVGAISLAYAQASDTMQPAEPVQEQQVQPSTDIAPAAPTDSSPAPQAPTQAQTYDNNTPATVNAPVPDNSAPLITERTPRADRN